MYTLVSPFLSLSRFSALDLALQHKTKREREETVRVDLPELVAWARQRREEPDEKEEEGMKEKRKKKTKVGGREREKINL